MEIRKILMIDDEPDIRLVASLSLTRMGPWQVVEASSGAEGLRLAASESPDLILLDVMMPSLDGPSTLARLRAAPATAAIPVVFMTAKAQRHELDRLVALGAAGVIPKPFDPMRLADELRLIAARLG